MNNDLISRSAHQKHVLSLTGMFTDELGFALSLNAVASAIEVAPAVDAEPVRHARWLLTNDDNKKRCGGCDVIHLIAQYPHGQANYCPNCGAKMDAEVKG